MQQEAARKLGFTAQRTMQVAQQLYEIDTEGWVYHLYAYGFGILAARSVD